MHASGPSTRILLNVSLRASSWLELLQLSKLQNLNASHSLSLLETFSATSVSSHSVLLSASVLLGAWIANE